MMNWLINAMIVKIESRLILRSDDQGATLGSIQASYNRQERDCLPGITAGRDRAMLNMGDYGSDSWEFM